MLDMTTYAGTAGDVFETRLVGAPPCASDNTFSLGARR